jgi:hypothetical protein
MVFKISVFLVSVLLICLVGWRALGQSADESILLGQIQLRLGMAEGNVLEKLGEKYDVSEYGRSLYSAWWVTEKTKPSRLVGSLSFKDGILTSVLKYWTTEGTPDTRAGLADSLFAAVNAFEREGRTVCMVSTGSQPTSSYDVRAVFITCGRKHLRIDISKGERSDSASITEVLEIPKGN